MYLEQHIENARHEVQIAVMVKAERSILEIETVGSKALSKDDRGRALQHYVGISANRAFCCGKINEI